jgi:hypothetical protein
MTTGAKWELTERLHRYRLAAGITTAGQANDGTKDPR